MIDKNGGEYDIYTEPGQSGSPVFFESEKLEIVGIHKGYQTQKNINICTLISQEMIQELK